MKRPAVLLTALVALAATTLTAETNDLSSVASAKDDLSILKVGNYLIQQGHHAHQISIQCEALGVARKVRVAAVESLYYHAPMVGAHRQKGLQEEAWLPFIRGEWNGKGRVRLNNKKPETRKAFIKQSPDLVLLMADLNGRHRHGVQGKGDEYYAHLVEVMKFYAKTCKENGARLVLWIHPGKQQAHDVIDRKTKEAAPLTEEEYAADLAAIQGGLDKLSAAIPDIEYLPIPWIFSRLRQDHPDVNLRAPLAGTNGHLSWREYLVGTYALAAHLGAGRPETPPLTTDELNKLIGIPAARHFKHLAQEDLLLTEDAHKAIIDAVWKGTTEAE